jgi:type II secretory pathway predicted ATPase ExeA
MYESFFHLTTRPFVAAPLIENYYPAAAIEQSHQTLVRIIDRAEGPGLIVGPAGVGKTMLCRLLAERFRETFDVAMLSSTRIITRKALLQNILFELKLPYREMEEGELRLSLLDHLQPNSDSRNGMLLIVDEAHSLALRLLEEIRMITNLVREGQPRVRLILAGGPKLEERFANPKLDSFNQRIAARCYLESFDRDDTMEYVRARIGAAGANPDSVFTEDALRAIYQATDGIPRLINQVGDHALVMAFAGGRELIDGAGIEEAWADLQQLPGPWQETPEVGDLESTTIEFGDLDGAPGEVPASEESSEAVFETVNEGTAYDAADDLAVDEDEATSTAISANDTVEFCPTEPDQANVAPVVNNPFGDDFEEEEIVIDQLSINESEAFANRPQVASPEGRALSASLRDLEETSQSEPVVEASQDAEVADSFVTDESELTSQQEDVGQTDEPLVETNQASPQPESLPVSEMFQYTVFEATDTADVALETLCEVNVALGSIEAPAAASEPEEVSTVKLAEHCDDEVDDRDMIVVDEEPSDAQRGNMPQAPTTIVQQIEYQDLFAQLRQS